MLGWLKDSGVIAGVLLVVAGLAMAISARGFPSVPVMPYGAGFFPTIVACGLILSGAGMLIEGARGLDAREAKPGIDPVALVRMGVLLGIIAFFALALGGLGFHITAVLALGATSRLFGGRWLTVAILAPVGAVLMHLLFYNVLRVPLPWGLMTPIAW